MSAIFKIEFYKSKMTSRVKTVAIDHHRSISTSAAFSAVTLYHSFGWPPPSFFFDYAFQDIP